ncbi:MAG: CTP synthase [Thermoprotei archaeon]|nr:MAG: CTP synthase [Thermoprotei archaeon]
MSKHIYVTGGVVSGIGKGVVTASIAKILQWRSYNVDVIKIDPYLNVDPGTLNPIEHGEVFVCEERWSFSPLPELRFNIAEVDQDFGTYERFLDKEIHPSNNITSGQVYLSVILAERQRRLLGRTIQVIPHITDEVKRRIKMVEEKSKPDILIIEIGGTVGDIEAMPFLEAVRQLRLEKGRCSTLLVHVTLVPYLKTIRQLKTKPTQHSVKTLQSLGLQPDVIIARSELPLDEESRRKISLYSNVPYNAVIPNPDLKVSYEVPLVFEREGLGDYIVEHLCLECKSLREEDYLEWKSIVESFKKDYGKRIRIAMPGKYVSIKDSYISIYESLLHSAAKAGVNIDIVYVDSEKIEKEPSKMDDFYSDVDGILLTPGFGRRGSEGLILSAKYAIENDIPLLGICFGAQLLFISYMRYFVGLKDANSTELDPDTLHPVVDLLPEQRHVKHKGASMRLGAHKILVKEDTMLYKAYKRKIIYERFRHRYHIIRRYAEMAEKHGLVISSTDESGRIVNSIEVKDKSWIVGVQFHPEFKSRPGKPSPIYLDFVKAAIGAKDKI